MTRPDPTVVTPATLRDWPLPEPGSDKSARGAVALVAGTSSTPGAVLLAGESALRAGAGKLAIATAAAVAGPLAVAVPESLVVGLPTTSDGSIEPGAASQVVAFAEGADAVLLGPGFADVGQTVRLMGAVVADLSGPLVVDALGSSYLTEHPEGLRHLGGAVVLTVNPTELARTAGRDVTEVEQDPYAAASAVARRSDVVVLCGGETKSVVTPDGSWWVVEGGGPGLGVSGSGDVQAGVVAGLLARGAAPAQAAVWAGYLHARAGERMASVLGKVGYLARELPAHVPQILTELG